MKKDELELITTYIAGWMWHIITIILLSTFIICLVLKRYPFAFGIAGAMIVSEFMSWKRVSKLNLLIGEK
jgi:hypothetical protein